MAKCPFSWTQQEKGCLFSKQTWEPVECLGERCQLWAGTDCVFNQINDNLKKSKPGNDN